MPITRRAASRRTWCDARAFCEWAGKRLCGRLDADGGAIAYLQTAAPVDEWFSACSDGGANLYPYGDTYDASTCKGAENKPNAVIDVGSLSTCTGGYAGIFDMSGNVWEYENGCDNFGADAATQCFRRGGSISELSGQLTCGSLDEQPRLSADTVSGIRCCAD